MNVDVIPRHGADMCDATAHLARTDNTDTLDLVAHLSRLTDFRMRLRRARCSAPETRT